MEASDVRALLRARIERAGSLRKAATELSISAAYLSDIMLGRREPGRKVCDALGIEKTVIVQCVTNYVRYTTSGVEL